MRVTTTRHRQTSSKTHPRRSPVAPSNLCLRDCLIISALNGLSVGFVLTDPSGKVLWLNRAAESVLGTKRATCTGQSLAKLLRDPQLALFWQQTGGADGTVMGEICVRWPQKYELKINCTQSVDAGGSLIGRALLFCDVTQERTTSLQLSQALAHRLLGLAPSEAPVSTPKQALTAQELRILRLLGEACSNEKIAEELVVETSTVRSHLKSLYRKLNLKTRAEIVTYAARNAV